MGRHKTVDAYNVRSHTFKMSKLLYLNSFYLTLSFTHANVIRELSNWSIAMKM